MYHHILNFTATHEGGIVIVSIFRDKGRILKTERLAQDHKEQSGVWHPIPSAKHRSSARASLEFPFKYEFGNQSLQESPDFSLPFGLTSGKGKPTYLSELCLSLLT